MPTVTETNSATAVHNATAMPHTPEAQPKSETPFVDSARERAHEIVDKVAESSSKAEKNLRAAAEKSGEKMAETQQKAKETMGSSVETAKRLIQDYPLAAAGVVFTAGILFGSWMRRS